MALTNVFKNSASHIRTTDTTCYACPVNTSAVMQSLFVCNTNSGSDITIIIKLYQASSGSSFVLAYQEPVPQGSTYYLDRNLNLSTGDLIQVRSSIDNSCDAIASVLEMS